MGEEPAGHPSSGGRSHLAFPKFGCFSNKAGSTCQQQGLPTTSPSTSFFFFLAGRGFLSSSQLFYCSLNQSVLAFFFFFPSRDSLFLLWQFGVYLEPVSVPGFGGTAPALLSSCWLVFPYSRIKFAVFLRQLKTLRFFQLHKLIVSIQNRSPNSDKMVASRPVEKDLRILVTNRT